MYAETYVLITAMLRGLSTIPTRKGLQYSNPNTSTLTYLVFNTVLLWGMTLVIYPIDQLKFAGLEYFAIAGICAPGLARIFRDTGIMRLGVTVSSPIVSTNTLFSVMIAVVFLGEEITLPLLAGALMIFLGVNVITWQNGSRTQWNKRDVIHPLVAAMLFASSTNFRKIGLNRIEFPLAGAAITSTVSLVALSCSLLISRSRNSAGTTLNLNREAMKYFIISSIISSAAYIFYFLALSASNITKIQPIAGTNPLWAILFSYIFLKQTEIITAKTVMGAVIIVLGIALVFF
jgi:uncharacterized membrane protein